MTQERLIVPKIMETKLKEITDNLKNARRAACKYPQRLAKSERSRTQWEETTKLHRLQWSIFLHAFSQLQAVTLQIRHTAIKIFNILAWIGKTEMTIEHFTARRYASAVLWWLLSLCVSVSFGWEERLRKSKWSILGRVGRIAHVRIGLELSV